MTKLFAVFAIALIGSIAQAKNLIVCQTTMLGPGAGGQTELVLQGDSILRFYTNLTFQNRISQQTLTFDSSGALTNLDLIVENTWGVSDPLLLKFGELNKCAGQTSLEVRTLPNAVSPAPKMLQSMVCECTQK